MKKITNDIYEKAKKYLMQGKSEDEIVEKFITHLKIEKNHLIHDSSDEIIRDKILKDIKYLKFETLYGSLANTSRLFFIVDLLIYATLENIYAEDNSKIEQLIRIYEKSKPFWRCNYSIHGGTLLLFIISHLIECTVDQILK